MKTADWPSVVSTQVLLIGENSTLQWKDEVLEHAMFLDYYFRHAPYDLGERSRYSEARTIFESLEDMTAGVCRAEQVHGTLLSNDILARPPRGKHILVPEKFAREGLDHINGLLKRLPTIKYIFVMGMQANYYLQKFGFYSSGDNSAEFIKGAEPRRTGISSYNPYYQPVNAKPFRQICFKRYRCAQFPNIEAIPILPVKSYPLAGSDLANFNDNYQALKQSFTPEE
ncbi:MAG: hypothetical protein SNF93_00125 [Rikenellaceae bacterium]